MLRYFWFTWIVSLALSGDLSTAPATGKPILTHFCAAQASVQARKLLEFHFGKDDRIAIDQTVRTIAPLRNPVGKDLYTVLEMDGWIYKGKYRIRMIFATANQECVLMGQEILELANH